MKILVKGKIRSNPQKYVMKCKNCGCIFEFDSTDTTVNSEICRSSINCPSCGRSYITTNAVTLKNWWINLVKLIIGIILFLIGISLIICAILYLKIN